MTTTDDERTLHEFSERLTQALQILDLRFDHTLLLELAEKSSKAVIPDAGAISTFVVGYAAGLAATSGEKEASAAVETAAQTALLVVAHGPTNNEGPADGGWAESAQ